MIDRLTRFRDGSGRTADNPLVLAGPVPGVDLRSVGLLLAPPALTGEFMPASMWSGVQLLQPEPATSTAEPGELGAAFSRAVADLVTDTDTIGVLFSGGLDSLAVLHHAEAVADGRRVLAFTVDLVDDTGVSAAAAARRLMTDLGLRAEHVVLDPDLDRARPAWSPAGPRLDALPENNAAVAERAEQLGVGILFSGDGSDELLSVPRFAAGKVAARHGARAAARYIADLHAEPHLLLQTAARLLPRRMRTNVYWAANWPEWCDPVPTPVLAEPYRTIAYDWACSWVKAQIDDHYTNRRDWAEADAWDAMFPHTAIPPAGDVPEDSPFLHPRFLSTALALPLGDRYQPHLATSYHRRKGQVINLLPQRAIAALPHSKQLFRTALANVPTRLDGDLLAVQTGLIDPDAVTTERDPAILLMVASIERWLHGAQDIGASIISAA